MTNTTVSSLEELLTECAILINGHGPDSDKVDKFIQRHEKNKDFVELATIARTLKKGLVARENSEQLTER